jgi:hypothetical protein
MIRLPDTLRSTYLFTRGATEPKSDGREPRGNGYSGTRAALAEGFEALADHPTTCRSYDTQASNLMTKDLASSAHDRINGMNELQFGSPIWTRFELLPPSWPCDRTCGRGLFSERCVRNTGRSPWRAPSVDTSRTGPARPGYLPDERQPTTIRAANSPTLPRRPSSLALEFVKAMFTALTRLRA